MAFSPDGKMIAPPGHDHTVRLWPIDGDTLIQRACALAGRNLRQQEWNDFVGRDRRYVRACADLPPGYGAPADGPAATYHIDTG